MPVKTALDATVELNETPDLYTGHNRLQLDVVVQAN